MMEELLIQNASIIDGSGKPAFWGSLSVSGKYITGIWHDPWIQIPARKVLNAEEKVLCPGFVDTHTHSDMVLLHDGRQASSITQGVTTEIIGQDGLSYAPSSPQNLPGWAAYLKGLDGQFDDVILDFRDVAGYLDRFRNKTAVNVAYLVPHSNLRLETVGFFNRRMTDAEMEAAKEMLERGICQGAKGLSTGLSYFPGAYGDTEELAELCRTVKKYDGVYVTHLRTVFPGKPFNAVEEALDIARKSGVKLHFSHYRTGGSSIGNTQCIMERIDRGIEEGLDISLELYPYPYGASYGPMLIPPWASEGGTGAILERLKNPEQRARIAEDIDRNFPKFDAVISYAAETPDYMGKTLGDLCRRSGKTVGQLLTEVLYSEKLALGFHDPDPELDEQTESLFEQDILELLSRPNYMVGSDSIHLGTYPHPRAWGAFARILRIAREHGFALETVIERMTALPCRRFAIEKRGQLQKGCYADMVLFDPETSRDKSDARHPRERAEGITDVWVNGCAAMAGGKLTETLSGCPV